MIIGVGVIPKRRHVFEHEEARPERDGQPQKVEDQQVPLVTQVFLPARREALAWWAAEDNIDILGRAAVLVGANPHGSQQLFIPDR